MLLIGLTPCASHSRLQDFVPSVAPVVTDEGASAVQGYVISVPVLDNDFDPNGLPLTLIDADADFGDVTYTAQGTVNYTAPAMFTGPARVNYTVSNTSGVVQEGQMAVEVVEDVPLDLVVTPRSTLEIVASRSVISLEIVQPETHAGLYEFDGFELANGPLNLVPPTIEGIAGAGFCVQASPGLWVNDVTQEHASPDYQWQLDGVDILGAQGKEFDILSEHVGHALRVAETFGDGSQAQQAYCQDIIVIEIPVGVDTFDAPDGTALLNHTNHIGVGWVSFGSGNSLVLEGGRARGTDSGISYWKQDLPAVADQRVTGDVFFGSAPSGSLAIACRCTVNAGSYWFLYRLSTNAWELFRDVSYQLATTPDLTGFAPGGMRTISIQAIGDTVTCFVDGIETLQVIDTTYASGTGGLRSYLAEPSGAGFEVDNFSFEDLT